jgi:hypothetical protein
MPNADIKLAIMDKMVVFCTGLAGLCWLIIRLALKFRHHFSAIFFIPDRRLASFIDTIQCATLAII